MDAGVKVVKRRGNHFRGLWAMCYDESRREVGGAAVIEINESSWAVSACQHRVLEAFIYRWR